MNAKRLIVLLLFVGLSATAQKSKAMNQQIKIPSLYDQNFKVQALNGDTFDMNSLKGKKVLIVNTASKCGLTPQYEQLQALYEKYKDKCLVIVGFPANNFAEQEPGNSAEIAEFCKLNYGVTFPMMEKVSVKGQDMAPIYKFLTQKAKNGVQDSEVEWNFQKYLINEKGELEQVISPRTLPSDEKIVKWVSQAN